MPYKKNQDGTMNCTGKIAEWITDFEKWYSQDAKNSNVPMGNYSYWMTFNYGILAKKKWENGIFTKGKIKIIDSMITKHNDGSLTINEPFLFLDFLAENLKTEDRISWSQDLRNKFIKEIGLKNEQQKSKQESLKNNPNSEKMKPITVWQAILKANLKINNSEWKIAFLSNTGVTSSVSSNHFSSADKALMLPNGQAGQWILEYFRDSPIILSDEGRSYPFRRMLVTSNGASELPESNLSVRNKIEELDSEFLKKIDLARELAISKNDKQFDVISAYSDVRSNGACFWKFRFYDLQNGNIVNKICISSDGISVCEW